MAQKRIVNNFTSEKESMKIKVKAGILVEPIKGCIKKEERRKPDYRKIIKVDKDGNEKRHNMLIEEKSDIYRKSVDTAMELEREREREMEENKDKRADVDKILNNKGIMKPEEIMEFYSNVIQAKVVNANGIKVGMEQRLKAGDQLLKAWKEFAPDNPEDEIKAINVNIVDTTDKERVNDIAKSVGLSTETLDEIRAKQNE